MEHLAVAALTFAQCRLRAHLIVNVDGNLVPVHDRSISIAQRLRARLYPAITAVFPTPAILHLEGVASFERSEEHTSELQSLMRISYAVFCLKHKKLIMIRQAIR